jgi:hypothetical protein
VGTNGGTNLGGGGGGGGGGIQTGGYSGGSGVIAVQYDARLRVSIGSGLVTSSSTTGNLTTLTITSGTDTVTFF